MKKSYFLILFNILFYLFNNSGIAQDFNTSNFIYGSENIRVNETIKLTEGYVLFGDFLGTISRPETIIADNRDIFLAKYDENFNPVWIKHIGGTLIDLADDIVFDSEANMYIIGSIQGTCSFDGLNELTSDGNYDMFIAKYTSAGNLLWAKKIAYNSASQRGTSIDFDGSSLIIAGYYTDSINFDTESFTSAYGLCFTKFDLNGTFIWAKNITTTNSSSTLQSVSAFSDGYYFNGRFRGTASFDLGNFVSNNGSYADVFLYKTDFNGDGEWLRRTYGDGNAFTGTMAQDNYGNVYYTGFYGGTSMEVDSTSSIKGKNPIINNGGVDIFVLKYNKNGILNWYKGYGRDGTDWARDIKFQNNALYITGYFSDSIIFGNDTLVSSSLTDKDAFIGIFDREGNTLKTSKIDDSNDNNESGMTISVDQDNMVYWGGTFKSSTVVVGDSTFVNPNPGKQCVFITKGKTPFSAVFSKKVNSTCFHTDDGELTVTPYFGVAPYTYSWSPNTSETDSTATGLAPATYTVTVTDAMASTAEATYTITEPDPITFNPAITNVTQCSYTEEGVIDLNVAGGNSGYAYQWQASDGGYGVVLSAEDQSGLTVGTYDVTVTDSKSCTGDTTMYITGPDPITFNGTIVTDSSEAGGPGAIDLVYTGGFGDPASFTFDWQGPSGTTTHSEDTSNLSPGNYSVTVTDLHVCEFDTMFNVANLDTFYIYISDYKDACNNTFNGNATVSYSSPHGHTAITYLWDANTGSQTTAQATGLASGRSYYVTVTDTENTPNTVLVDSVFIDELSYIFAGSLAGTTTLDCYGDTDGYIDLTITSEGELPYSYNWSNSETTQDITNLSIGTYGVTATDANECTFSITNYVIDQPTAISAVAEIVNSPTCNGDLDGEVTVLRNGGTVPYTYQWNDPGSQTTQNADGLDAGYYTVTVTDFNSCTAVSSINLTEPEAIDIIKVVNNETCNSAGEGSVSLTVSGGSIPFTYFWSTTNGSGLVVTDKNQSGLTAGKYYFTATDDHNCTYEDSIEITEPPVLEITNEEKTNITTCNGDNTGTITITATGGTGVLTYILNPGAIQTNNTGAFTGILAGTYTVDVDDENGCGPVTSSSIEITEPTQISITAETPTDISCNGLTDGQIVIAASGGTGTLQYSIDNGTTYQTSGTFSGLAQGTNYQVKVKDDNDCEVAGTTLTINEPTQISIDSETPTDISCNGLTDGQIVIVASGGTGTLEYSIDNGTTYQTSGTFSDLAQGTNYQVKLKDDNACEVAGTTLTINEPAVINLESSGAINPTCNGSTDGSIDITISGGTIATNYTYSWATTDGSGLVADAEDQTGLSAGTYNVTVTDDNSCASVFAIVLDDPLEISIDSENSTDASSQTTDDGTITVVATGGTGNLTYDLNPGDDSNITGIFNGLLPGDYTVDVTDENSCGPVSSNTITVGFVNAIDDLIISDKIKVYPNPTSAKLNIEIDFEIDDVYKIEILTISGQVLFNKEIKSHGITKEELDLSNYPKGIYFIRIYNNQFIFKEKILLQ